MRKRAFFDADVVVGQYATYADNRRAAKTVTRRGELDGTTYFFYDGLREIEERSGSEAVTQQYVWGHEYIDQLLRWGRSPTCRLRRAPTARGGAGLRPSFPG